MATQLSDNQVNELRTRIQGLLEQECRSKAVDFTLKIVEDFLQEGEILSFVVIPDHKGVRAYDYADVLTSVESRLRKDDGLNVLLVPARPD